LCKAQSAIFLKARGTQQRPTVHRVGNKKNCRKDDLTSQNGDLTSKNGDLTSKNGDFTTKNGDLTLGKMGLIKPKWEMCQECWSEGITR
jgi:hypothetical protein